MAVSFLSEIQAWKSVFFLRRRIVGFYSLLIVVIMIAFLSMVWVYRLLDIQVSQLADQTEVLVEFDSVLDEEQQQLISKDIEELQQVESVDYWSPKRSAQYIDQYLVSGYLSFLQKHQLDVAIGALLRIQLKDLDERESFGLKLKQRYGDQIQLVNAQLSSEQGSFVADFVESLSRSIHIIRVIMVLILFVLLFLSGYLIVLILSERSHGFHPIQLMHLMPPYQFWPALLAQVIVSLSHICVAFFVVFFISGHFFFRLSLLLLLFLVILNIIFVWVGRFLVVKWSMR